MTMVGPLNTETGLYPWNGGWLAITVAKYDGGPTSTAYGWGPTREAAEDVGASDRDLAGRIHRKTVARDEWERAYDQANP